MPTRADRCTYVLYGDRKGSQWNPLPKKVSDLHLETALDYMLDPVMHNQAQGRTVHGTVCLHVDDLFMSGDSHFEKTILQKLREEFQVGSEDKNDVLFVGQPLRWYEDKKNGPYIHTRCTNCRN